MNQRYKPDGYNDVSAYLIVDGAAATIEFLKRVFDADELRARRRDDGSIMHAEVRLGDTVMMIADSVEGWPAVPTHVHVYVPDVDETYRRAAEAGAESVQEPVQQGDADRRGGIRDAGGTTWWIGTTVA
jgi:uncharacterized glyoxalase superfamily protein PhnB